MDELKYVLLTDIQGRADAEVLKAFLLGNGIEDVELIQESLGRSIYPTTLDILGNVQVFVPREPIEAARQLLGEYQELQSQEPEESQEEEPKEETP